MSNPKPTIYLLSASAIADDPRVRRMGDALHALGWRVTGIGLTGARGRAPEWRVIESVLPQPPAPERSGSAAAAAERTLAAALTLPLVPAGQVLRAAGSPWGRLALNIRDRSLKANRPFRGAARALGWRLAHQRLGAADRIMAQFWRQPAIAAIRDACSDLPGPAIWMANDWQMLPVASAGAARTGGVLVYDSHELATEESADRPEWRRFVRPMVCAVEADFIRQAQVVSAVSPGIVAHLQSLYAQPAPHFSLRNTPIFEDAPFRETGERIRVLYHGIVVPGRGLEASIESVADWPPLFDLTIRGPDSPPGYAGQLKALAAARGVGDRVTLEAPVPMTELVAAARPFDIGLMALPGHSLHNQYALPNKVFEYLMAHLALAVSDLPEMRTLVHETGAGLLIGEGSAAEIAAAFQALTRGHIQRFRLAARDAARRYNWETQAAPVIAAYEQAFRAAIG
ncbi:MAG: glycosyltransferase family 4 protein [Hyphomonas sp.]|uniref:hypothetical protein n=1 Tax=Hyphomonas sp. TaxID=87 RepID=UPI001814C5DB|nr:hypothetical protein [Hyphomonas sp.]MBU3919879.1 hypothetical protein [Alphaproteobacteria bacterium]MBA3067811.1 glycosyltransferase family 4 protein [Hyphomonas sp.]MBU4063903.1 hypothetical protein [Alphaproteobacteria bacterium]MBU4163299.1 hypothetical protein [Alphaproteobacteria bacterium]MBU4568767.1 hypothetical protein [Alphaproteobacteria bacterium]